MLRKSNLFWIPLWIYLCVSAIAVFYTWYKGIYDPAHSEFAGLPLMVLGLPWSFTGHNFNPKLLANEYQNSIVVECLFIGCNAVILGSICLTARKLARRSPKA